MNAMKIVGILIGCCLLCSCPSSAVLTIINENSESIYLSKDNDVFIVRSNEVKKLYITDAVGMKITLKGAEHRISEEEIKSFNSEIFKFVAQAGEISSAVFIVDKNGYLIYSRKLNKDGKIVFPKKQPKGFPYKIRN